MAGRIRRQPSLVVDTRPISWSEAARILLWGDRESDWRSLRAYVRSRVLAGVPDPAVHGGRNQPTLKALLHSCPELRPQEDRAAISYLRHYFDRTEDRFREIAREEAELALRRHFSRDVSGRIRSLNQPAGQKGKGQPVPSLSGTHIPGAGGAEPGGGVAYEPEALSKDSDR